VEKIRKGDDVVVVVGRDKGRRGSVIGIVEGDLLLVQGVNKVKKHQRPNPMKGITGGVVEKEMPVHRSNIAIFNSATQRADKVGIKSLDDGSRVRIYKSTGEQLKV
jgi:large subunit ribosomal protein L24